MLYTGRYCKSGWGMVIREGNECWGGYGGSKTLASSKMDFAAGCAGWISGVTAWSGGGGSGAVSLFPYSFCSHLSFHRGGKFSFCWFAEKKNRGTGRKLAISWKSKLPSAAATGASYFQKMALALPSSIMHSGIQNRNKEMALDPKLHHSSSSSVAYANPRARFDSFQFPEFAQSCERVSFAWSYRCVQLFLFFRSGLLRDACVTRPIGLCIKKKRKRKIRFNSSHSNWEKFVRENRLREIAAKMYIYICPA